MAVVFRLFYCCILAVLVIPSCSNTSGSKADSVKRTGQEIYASTCSMCHGRYGNAGLSGATDLTVSNIAFDDAVNIVKNGKGAMQAYGEQLSKKEIEAVVEYALSFRK